MRTPDRQKHWEKIYRNKNIDEVSWYQKTPSTSLYFIRELNIPLNAKIIDIGGGDSFFVDYLLELGYENITVLDISKAAIDKAKDRLGSKSAQVKWIVSDIVDFMPEEKYDLWHDRAAFHFLTDEADITKYLYKVEKSVKQGGYMITGTFSENGPDKCSGITIQKYSEYTMTARFASMFRKIKCIYADHKTPSGSVQNFIFCSFQRLS